VWTYGNSGSLLTLYGADTNDDGDYGVRIACKIGPEEALQAWGVAFHLVDDEWPD
jgi:hypothetical protein